MRKKMIKLNSFKLKQLPKKHSTKDIQVHAVKNSRNNKLYISHVQVSYPMMFLIQIKLNLEFELDYCNF